MTITIPLTCKFLTRVTAEKQYEHLESQKQLPTGQEGYRKGRRDFSDQLLIDKMIINNCKGGLSSLSISWIDYEKNTYNIIP